MKITDVVDKVWVTNLARRTDRLETVTKELAKHDIPFEKWVANDHLNTDKSAMWWRTYNLKNQLLYAEAEGYRSILLLDDDVYFCKDFAVQFDYFWKQVPLDWDAVSLSSIFWQSVASQEFVTPSVIRSYQSWGAHATLVKHTVYDDFLNALTGEEWCDVELAYLHPYMNYYVACPALVGQRAGHSDLQNRHLINEHYGIERHEDDK